ncbi:unnamed protein product [Lactuca virosa]|uniref:Myb-like domain-containing protein n=1 Tax=Lactuca virosa TaxID=75947 RepID=A0AAU9P159_9ASTR|nr:unnamed protein product [Lactuca virosa]
MELERKLTPLIAAALALKSICLVWTPQLHKRFVKVVAHLGVKSVVPKTIMQMMNVEGLTRENGASHLQKYRLFVKRMHGSSNEGPSSSDPLFASATVPRVFTIQISRYYINFSGRIQRLGYKRNDHYSSSVEMLQFCVE